MWQRPCVVLLAYFHTPIPFPFLLISMCARQPRNPTIKMLGQFLILRFWTSLFPPFLKGQKRPQPSSVAGALSHHFPSSTAASPLSIAPLLHSQLLLGSGIPSLQNSLLTLADANLLQQVAATQNLVNFQQQEIAAKRIRFACPQILPISTVSGNQIVVSSAATTVPTAALLNTNTLTNQQGSLIQLSPSSNPQSTLNPSSNSMAQLTHQFHHHHPQAMIGGGGTKINENVAVVAGAVESATNGGNGVVGNELMMAAGQGVGGNVVGNGGGEFVSDGGRYPGDNGNYIAQGADPNGLNNGGGVVLPMGQHSLNGGSISQSYQDLSSGVQHQPNSILRIIIDCMLYPVTLDVLYMIFSRYGKVLRIITFNKNNSFQALIQLSEASAAQNAKATLDGMNIYNGCCTLRIEFSKLNTLNVKYNNDKSRDYTNPNLPSGELTYEQKLQLILQNAQLGGAGAAAAAAANHHHHQFAGAMSTLIPFSAAAAAAAAAANASAAAAAFPFNAAGAGGAAMALQTNNASAVTTGQVLPNNLTGIVLNTAQFQSVANTPVILVSNLDEATVTPDQLFILFGVYGDVVRVKILFNKKDNALIQYADPQQAQLAIQHLDKVKWNGRNIRVTSSKHNVVQMPKEGQPDAGLTKEFLNNSLHRFKKPGSKNYMNIYPPSSTLHLSNIPTGMTEEQMNEIFKGLKIVEFKFFQKDHKMALVQMEDIESAVTFLIEMHNYKLADNAHLRVSFSKKGING